MKISKTALKAIIKECLVEILAEGLGPTLTEAAKAAPRAAGPRNRDAEPLPGDRMSSTQRVAPVTRRPSSLDERVVPRPTTASPLNVPPEIKAITRDPIMAAIFADTARTTLQEQARGVSAGDMASQAVAQVTPEQMFDEKTVDTWNRAAFAQSRPGPVGLPSSFIQDLIKGE